jgi:tetratricopeptide (TPR) repeat protein
MPINLNTTMLPLVVLLLFAAMSPTTTAFVQLRSSSSPSVDIASSKSSPKSKLFYSFPGKDDGFDSHSYTELQDLEQARSSFEMLFQQATAATSTGKCNPLGMFFSSSTSQQPILTTGARRRRQLEMELVASLTDSDDAADILVNLWMHETGDRKAAAVMAAMQESCSQGLVREEKDLLAIIAQSPSWAEPKVRLAFVYYFQDRFEDSSAMAKKAIQLKPWHFEAARLLVLLSGRQLMMGQTDTAQALLEAHQRALPTLRPNLSDGEAYAGRSEKMVLKRRRSWVDRALNQAAEQLDEAEKATEQVFQETHLHQPTNEFVFE